jgi:phosphate transport system substrate-binding protein
MLAAAIVLLFMSMIAMPMLGADGSSLPPPVGVSATVNGDSVNLTWRAPTTSAGRINQTGCDSSFVLFSAINGSFAAEYPSIDIVLKGGGNNIAFSDWAAKRSDVAMASRKITADEAQRAQAAGLNVTETKVAVESIAVVVHPGTGITALTADQVKALFNGSVANWKDVGGADLAVTPYVPGPGGPPYLFFNNSLMAGSTFSSSVQFVKDSLACADAVANTSGGIGIVRTGYLDRTSGVQVVSIRSSPDAPALSPLDREAAYNSSYRLARNYYLYTDGAPTGAIGMWVDYALSTDRGQKTAAENGFLPLTPADLAASKAMINGTSDDPVIGYKVYRTGAGGSNDVRSIGSSGYVDNVTAGQSYTYRVSAVYRSGEGAQSDAFTVTVPASGAPSGGTTASGDLSPYTLPIILLIVAVAAIVVVGLRKR